MSVVDVGFSDHLLLETDVNLQRPKPDVLRYTFRNIRQIDADGFAERLLQTDAYTAPSDDVDGFTSQLERSVTGVLDTLAPLQSRTKRSGKTNSRWLSEAAVAAKRKRWQFECRWKRTQLESDRVAYRAACHVANTKINSLRSAFYNDRLTEASGDQRTVWHVAKELLHSDSRPAPPSALHATPLNCALDSAAFSPTNWQRSRTPSGCVFQLRAPIIVNRPADMTHLSSTLLQQ